MSTMSLVPFHGAAIEALQHEGEFYVVVRRICASLGFDEEAQRQKLRAKPWAVALMIKATGADGKQYEQFCLSIKSLPMWLASINASKVKPDLRPTLELYQREAADVLYRHFLGAERERERRLTPPDIMPTMPLRPTDIAAAWAQAHLVAVDAGGLLLKDIYPRYLRWYMDQHMAPAGAALPGSTTLSRGIVTAGFKRHPVPHIVGFRVQFAERPQEVRLQRVAVQPAQPSVNSAQLRSIVEDTVRRVLAEGRETP